MVSFARVNWKLIVFTFMISFLFLTIVVPVNISHANQQDSSQPTKKKAILFVLDGISWDDIRAAEVPTIKNLTEHGYIGLMNTKTRGMNRVNRESGYFTIGVGMRANAPDLSGSEVQEVGNGNIKVKAVENLRQLLNKELPNYRVGQLGWSAKQFGFKVALVGNSDTELPHREVALAAMDEEGVIPLGYVGNQLLEVDNKFPGKYRTNDKVLLNKAKEFLPQTDILFIDYGDTARINEYSQSIANVFTERKKALEKADRFLGQLVKEVDRDNTLILIVVPNASQSSIEKGNTSLTPVIVAGGDPVKGFVFSNTTRREGLVANIDVAPTVFNFLSGKKGEFIGEPISYLENKAVSETNLQSVEKKERKFFNLRWGRFITHGFYVTFLILSLAFNFVPPIARYFRVSDALKYRLAAITLTYPLTVYVMGPLLPYRHFIFETIIIMLTAIVLTLAMINMFQKKHHVLMAACLGTYLVLLSYLYFAPSFLLNSPLGFDDVFLGGRYYGVNNDTMGILIGSALFGLFGLAQWSGFPKWVYRILIVLGLLLIVFAMTPGYGANVGGTIAAMSVTVLSILYLFTKGHLSWRKVLMVVVFVFAAEVAIAYVDSLLDPPKTHAGKAVQALLNADFGRKFSELLLSKLRLFGLMAVIPPYNLLLASELILFYRIFKGLDKNTEIMEQKYPLIYGSIAVFFYGGLIAFLFNDTGVIATAMMYTYFVLPWAVLGKD